MKTVAGVFRSFPPARDAAQDLLRSGFSPKQVNLLCPGSPEQKIHGLPTASTEQPGMGGAIGGVLGGALGVAGGLELGMAATALIPGVGPAIVFGLAGAALLVLTITCDGGDSSWTGTTITPVATGSPTSTSAPSLPATSPLPPSLVPGSVEPGHGPAGSGG